MSYYIDTHCQIVEGNDQAERDKVTQEHPIVNFRVLCTCEYSYVLFAFMCTLCACVCVYMYYINACLSIIHVYMYMYTCMCTHDMCTCVYT